jgi:uncharacterized protein
MSRFLRIFLLLIMPLLLMEVNVGFAQGNKKEIIAENLQYRAGLNSEFRDTLESPLIKQDLKDFKQIDFFPVRVRYCVSAKLQRTPAAMPFEMPRSKGNTGTYRKYGEATFSLNGKDCKLALYQSMKLINDEKYADFLFLPFADITNGKKTYDNGRFLDLKIPLADEIIIDFNKAYNPLCAYGNPKYSCPIPPKENHLQVAIKAGVKKYKK